MARDQKACSTCFHYVSQRCQRNYLQPRRKAVLLKETLIKGWRIVLRANAQIFNKFQRNSFPGPWEFWKAKYAFGFFYELFIITSNIIIIIYIITAVLLLLIITIIIQLMQLVIIILLIKASSRNDVRKKIWNWLGLLLLTVWKEY